MTIKRQMPAMILVFVLLTLVGCGQKEAVLPAETSGLPTSSVAAETVDAPPSSVAEPSSVVEPSPSESAEPEELDEFRTLILTDGNEKAALDILSRLAPDLGTSEVTWMFFALEDYQKAAIEQGNIVSGTLVKLIQSASAEPYDEKALNDIGTIEDASLKEALQALFDRGYKLVIPEGDYQAIIDYRAYGAIAPYLPPDLAAYVDIMAKESEQRMLEDGGIIIPLDEVITRALACEKFMVTYNASQRAEQISNLYSGYIDAYFFGADNTPAFDYATDKLNQEFLDSYTKYASDSHESAFIAGLTAYLRTLTENGYVLNQAVSDAREKFTEPLRLKPCYG